MANASPTPSQPTSPAVASRPLGTVPQLPLDLISESKTNPRKSLDQQADQELTDSVRVHGVIQPVTVRTLAGVGVPPSKGGLAYELVIGSRRFRAAQVAGLKQIPATICELTDEQAMEIQIVENLQREDVAPIDEGRGYTQLIAALAKKDPKRAADGQGVKRQDLVAEVARMVGKSPRYVYARMKLCELIPELQKDLEEGRIEASHADELVRLTAKDQKDVRGFGLYVDEREQRMDDDRDIPSWKEKTGQRACSVRNLKVIIERDYQLTLDKAKFPIESAQLKPLACTVCPKNTAVNALLPPAATPTCTDKECWRGKMRQHVENQARELAKKASSAKLVQVTLAHSSGANSGVIGRDGWKTAHPGECKNVVAATQVEESGGVKHFQSAKYVCTNKQCKVHFGAAPRPAAAGGSSAPAKKFTLEELRKQHGEALEGFIAERAPLEFLRQAFAKVEKIGEAELRLLVDVLAVTGWYDHRDLAVMFGRETPLSPEELAKKAKASDLPKLLMALVFCGDGGTDGDTELPGPVECYGEARGVDGGKIEAELRAALKTCEICGCFDQHGCDLGGGKRCSWVPKGAPAAIGVKTQLCNNPLCVAEASNRAAKAGVQPSTAAKKPGAKVAKKPVQASARPAKKKKAAARKKGGRR